jgi:hypothetical protein
MKAEGECTPILEFGKLPKPGRRPKATKAEATAMDREAQQLVAQMRSGWLRLGRLICKIIDTQAYEAMGFPTMKTWMDARLGESASSAFSALRSVRALVGVAEEKLNRIGERNANALSYLPEKERKSEEWIQKAATLPTKEFKQEVRIALEKKTGMLPDRFKTFSIALPEPVYDSMCAAERKLARTLQIDIEDKPGNRIQVWEAFTQWILLTDEETIQAQTEGIADLRFSTAFNKGEDLNHVPATRR